MYIKEIVIDGFKSYAKRTVIGNWDTQFNCITGLNGSGKSNILDAICFVLGITTMSTVRASNQQDLIYKRGQAGITKASVSIVFDNSDPSRSPLDYRDAKTITVTRQVVLGGTSKYLINGHRAQQNQVQRLFQEVQLNVNNPNFLIMQGQITKVLNMQPTEILALIEEAAGTGMYEKERQKAVKEIHSRDGDLRETETLANEEVRPRLDEMREKKQLFLEFRQCEAASEKIERLVAASEYAVCSKKLSDLMHDAEIRATRSEELKSLMNAESLKLTEIETQLVDLRRQQRSETSEKLEAELQVTVEEQTKVAGELEHKREQLATFQRDFESETAQTNRVLQQLATHTASVSAFETKHQTLQQQVDRQRQIVADKRELLTGLETGISTTGERETGFALTTKRAREALAESQSQLTALTAELSQLSQSISLPFKAQKQQELDELSHQLAEAQQLQHLRQTEFVRKYADAPDLENLKTQREELRDTIASISREFERLMAQFPNLDVPVDRNDPIWSHVKGRVAHVFQIKPEHEDKTLALETSAGGALWNLVVDNDQVGATVLKRSRKRMTVLPLNRMRTNVLNQQLIAQIDPQAAWLASDLLDFSPNVRPAIENVFGRTVICATAKIAERAAFQFHARAVTLSGDVFDPRGVISGGYHAPPAHGSSFSAVKQYQALAARQLSLENELAQVSEHIKSSGHTALLADQARNELELLHETIARFEQQQTECHQTLSELDAQIARSQALRTREIPEHEQTVATRQAALKTALQDAKEFGANREGKLRELREEVQREVSLERELLNQLEQESVEHSRNQFQLAQLKADLAQATMARDQAQASQNELSNEISALEVQNAAQTTQIKHLSDQLQTEVSRLKQVRIGINEVETKYENLRTNIAEMKLELQRFSHSQESDEQSISGARLALAHVSQRWSWAQEMAEVNAAELVSGEELNLLKQRLKEHQARIKSLSKRVDTSVLSTIQRLEHEEAVVRERIDMIKEDRRKLEELMQTLSERRCEKISEVWQQVSQDFGLIFGDLLPNSSCQLVPVNNQPIERGFSIKVRLGATWKEGLTELSGGQRSLVALSLILALLRYHPAPVYILDEVDAALDVHHTSNIGHIIKTRFRNAQFIVVSLKDDMFTNANRIYQTRFVDGTSTVAIMA